MDKHQMYALAETAANWMDRGDDFEEGKAIRQLIEEHKTLTALVEKKAEGTKGETENKMSKKDKGKRDDDKDDLWQVTPVDELVVGNSKWVTQFLVAPDKTRMVGLRKVVTLRSGEERVTSAGLTLPLDGDTAKTLRKLASMLKDLANSVVTELEGE